MAAQARRVVKRSARFKQAESNLRAVEACYCQVCVLKYHEEK